MIPRIINWLKPPEFADEEKMRRANVLNGFLLIAMLLLTILVATRPLYGSQLFDIAGLIISSMIVMMGVSLFVLRQGHVRTASIILVVFTWIGLAYLAWDGEGVRSTAYIVNIVVILFASLLLGWQGGLAFTAISIGAGWALASAEIRGLLQFETVAADRIARDMTIVFALVASLTFMFVRNITSALQRVKESNQQLELLRSSLEEQVTERTRNAE